MSKTKKLKALIVSALCAALMLCTGFALGELIPARAATTYTTHTQENGLQVGVSDGEPALWTLDNDTTPKKYTAVKNATTTPSLKFTIEGEQYFSFEYHFTANSYASSATNYFTVDIDDVQQCKVSNTGAENTAQEYIMKTRGAGTHTVVLWANGAKNSAANKQVEMYFQNFRLRNEGEFTKHNLTMDYNEKFLATYIVEGANGGWNGNKDTEEQIKAAATYLEPDKEYPLPEGISFCFISYPKTYISSISGEEIRSYMLSNRIQSADGKKQITNSGGAAKTTVTGCRITNTGIRQATNDHANTGSTSFQCDGYALKDITCEYAPQPQVSYAEYVEGVEVPHKLNENETVVLPNGQTTLPIRIRSTFKDYDKFYKVKVNGVETEVEWERKDETTIASAITVEQRSTVLVSGWFGEQYMYNANGSLNGTLGTAYLTKEQPNESKIDTELSFQFNIDVLTENGVKDVLADAKAENILEVVQDEAYPWYYDAARSDEGMAFTSGLSGASAEAKKISQLGFKVKGSGVLIFEFQIDGTAADITSAKKSWAAYNLDTKVSASSWVSGTSNSYFDTKTNYTSKKDFNALFGFKNTVATNIAYGLSNDSGDSKTGHRPSNPVHAEWTDPADQTKKNDKTTSNEKYWTSFEDTRKLHSTQLIATTADSEWYRVTIRLTDKQDADETTIYLAHAVYEVSKNYTAANGCSGERMTIRNVGFYPSNTSVSFAVENGEGTSASSNGTISVKADGKNITLTDGTPDASTPITLGARLTLTATPNEGNFFYGWQEVIGEKTRIFSYDKETSYSVMAAEVQIVALIAKEGTFAVRYGGEFYKTANVQDAFDAASTGADKTVIAVDNVTLTGALTIPAGVNFVISYNTKGGITEEGNSKNATNRVSWWEKGKYKDPVYKVTLGEGATLTVEGNFYVGGVLHYPDQSAQAHTSGAYSEFVNDGTVTVASGGVMDVCGRVTGKGGITVKNGGKLYQPFMILDYNGGTNTEAMFNNAHVTPFKMYAMVNIQCTGGYTIEYGGILFGHASLYFFSSITAIDQSFITYDKAPNDAASGLLIMKSGSTVKSVYDDTHAKVTGIDEENNRTKSVNNVEDVGKTTITVNGDVEAGYMDFLHTVQTNGVNFSLPYNYELEIASGNFTVANHFKVMPGAVVTVDSGATVTLKGGKSLHVYDSFYGPAFAKREYPTGKQLTDAGYNPYASLIVNGKLVVESGATFVGTVQTTGMTGTLDIKAGATLTASLHDGWATQYGCNYTKYTLKAQVYDSAHGKMADLKAGVYHAVTTEKTWTLPGITFQYEGNTNDKNGSHSLQTKVTDPAEGLTGSWKVEHGGHQYDWSQLSDEEKNLNGKKYKELTHQCTEIGCTEKEHKLLLAADFSLHAAYKGAEFDNDDLLAIFYQYYFEQDKVPDDNKSYFSASVTGATSIQNVQTYADITVTLTNGFFGDVSNTSATKAFTVDRFNVEKLDKSAIENAIEEKKFTYDGTEKQLSNEELEAVLKAEGLTGAVSHEAFVWANNTNAGTGTASVTIKGSGDNFEGELTVKFSIAKAQLTVTLEETTQTYGDEVKTPDITLGGVVNNEESQIKAAFTRTPQAEQWSEVGNYAVDWSYSEEEGVLANYEISFNNREETLYRVTAKDITKSATATAESATYNGTAQEAKLSFTFEGYTEHFGTGDYTVSYAKDGETSPVNAGTYTVTIKAQGNYSGSITCNYTIEKAQVTVIVTQQTYTFDRTQHSYNDQADGAWTAEGLQNEENKSLLNVSITGSGTDANTYAVTCSYNENGNYTVTFKGKETALVIEAAEIDSVTVTSSHTYDGQIYTPTLTVKAGELELNPNEYDVSYDKEEVKNADTYTVTVTAKESGNFKDKAEKASAQFRIEKATVTITAENKHSPQKQDLLELTAKVEGLIDPDQFEKGVDYTLTLPEGTTKDSAVDTYTITVTVKEGRETAWPNYEIKTVNGQYQITIAAFAELVFNDASKPYNGEAQKIEATLPHSDQGEYSVEYAYWKGEAESGQSISADEMVNAGKYTIVATVSFADNNGETYEATFSATLTIEKIKVTVKFEAKSSTYGDAVETDLTYTMSEDVLAKDTETVKAAIEPYTDAESKSNVGGSYKITAAKPVLDNYDVTIEDGVYTITARPVTVTVKKQTVTFNQSSQNASSETAYWTVEGLAAGDEASVLNVKLEAEGTDAKAYDIAASYQNNNYTVTFKGEGDLAVEGNTVKAAFVIEAATLTGAELTGSYTYNGNEQTPTFTVKAGSLTVAEGDYELAYADGADRVSAGTVQVTVKPKSENYTGTVETQFTIAQKQIKVTLLAQTAEYSGEVPTPTQDKYTVEEGGLCSRNGKEDDLGITITLVNGQKDAGDYGLTAEASNDDYEVTFEKSAKFTVTKKAITVKADDLTSVYGEAVQKLTYTAEGLVAGEDPQTVLHIELQASRSIKEAGTYEVTGTGSATNYTFEVTPGTYTVKEREVTVKINDQSALYNGKEPSVPQEQNKGWTITDGSIIDGDNLLIVLTKETGVNADEYEINGAFTNDNYKVTFEGTLGTAGKFTIDARTLTVVIEDQSATYNYQHQYTFDTAKWHVKAGVGDGLAEGEEKDILAVTLTKPEMTDAGDYEIAGAWDNENYTVTFEGTKQTKGTFTVEKQDVSDGAKFILGVEGDNFTTDGARGVRAKFAGEELVLFASASYFEGTESKTLEVTIDPAKIGEIGEFEVTVTIADKNYCGSTVFNVVVTDAAGYTKKLTEVLEQLETLAKGLDIDALKAEDYATLTEMYKAIQTLDEEERETGASALAEYQAYIDAWNALADTDAAVETAESIANGPIKGLFAGTAVMTALAALAYIVKKGGIL